MSLLDDILREVGGASGASADPSQHSLATDLLGMLSGGGMSRGLGGLVDMFNQKGLGDVMSSWVSTGQNLPISADQIQSVLGSAQVQALAAKAGIDPQMASAAIARILPLLVDKATPNGQLPAGGILDAISGFFKA
ncbi:MAG TPA: YidB family protein [Thermoanaerobaculia bacterium]|nr:YidB family protein [Thermoanaerobaculia bacterium]